MQIASTSHFVRLLAGSNPNSLERLYTIGMLATGRLPRCLTRSGFDPLQDLPVFAQHAPSAGYLEPKLRHLVDNGYDTVTVERYEKWNRGQWRPSRPSVMLTFDDGFRAFGERVMPLLRQYGCKAVLFVCPGLVDLASRSNDAVGTLVRRHYLDWDELGALAKTGLVDIQSHGMWHNKVAFSARRAGSIEGPIRGIVEALDALPPEQPLYDLLEGKRKDLPRYPAVPLYLSSEPRRILEDARTAKLTLEDRLGRRVSAFAFPWWNGSSAAVSALRDAGYDSVFWGLRPVRRCGVSGLDRIGRLSFDWIHCLPGKGRIAPTTLMWKKFQGDQRD
jgi:peptidoglycan/xylan/chitin deacetylase (PgdA/CDA1 family)